MDHSETWEAGEKLRAEQEEEDEERSREQRAELEEGEEWMTDIGADGDLQ